MTDNLGTAGLGSWARRRRFLYIVVAFCMVCVAYVLWRDLTSSVAETAITMAFICITSSVGGYVFGATWEDVQTRKVLGSIVKPSTKKPTVTAAAAVTTTPSDEDGGA